MSLVAASAVRGPAKRISRPPLRTHGFQGVAFGPGLQRPVGQDEHGDVALQQGRGVALAQFGERFQGALQEVDASR